MVYKRFRTNLIFRIILLLITSFLFVYFLRNTRYIFTPIVFGTAVCIEVYSLILYVEKTNRYLATFLESIRYSDFSRTFYIEGLGSGYDNLKAAFNHVIKDFQEIRSEKEANFHYLQNVIQHIGISLISYSSNGDVHICNNAAKRLFKMASVKNISDLKTFSDELVEILPKMRSGDKRTIKVNNGHDLLQLLIFTKEFKIKGQNINLVSIQNIQAELEDKEQDSWQKLISVLSHEIMNSITPISSLSSTVESMLEENTNDEIHSFDHETFCDIKDALHTINKRSNGLLSFVESYRNLTAIPKPDFKIFPIRELFENIELLTKADVSKNNVNFKILIDPPNLELTADMNQIEHILINLVKNAIHAMSDKPDKKLILEAYSGQGGRVTIRLTDNGMGILPNVLDKIFIPFFTTKSTGTGIGLSLSKQIMRQHGGIITAESIVNEKTVFTLKF